MKVSIIVPVYQVENYIKESMISIINQTFKDFEIIVVNDGSKDNSVRIAEDILINSDIKYSIINKSNEGVSSARNEGIKQASGDYLVFIDSDDVISPHFLEKLIKPLNHDYDFSFCNYKFVNEQTIIDEDNRTIDYIDYSNDKLINVFLKRNIDFLLTTMLIKKNLLIKNNIFFDENMNFSEDQKFMWEVIFASKSSVYINEKLYGYYLRPQSTMTSSSFSKITSGFLKYSEFCNNIDDYNLGNKILARWKLGTIYTSSKLLNYDEFIKVYNQMDIRNVFFSIIGLFEIKAIILSLVCFFPALTYKICRRM